MNQKFLCDFYRMTGKKFKRNIKSYLNIMFQHNVRYMYWWRKRNKKFIGKIARVFLFKYSKKYGLEIGNAKIEIGNDVLIAPNTYVNFNVPSHSIVIGSPGVIIPNEKATEGYVNFCV